MDELTKKIVEFRDERDWKQFHNPKDSAVSLLLEASELLEHFQWKNASDLDKYVIENKEKISHELSDVLYWVLLISHDLEIDILTAAKRKIELNAQKYPIDKSKGRSTKYNQL